MKITNLLPREVALGMINENGITLGVAGSGTDFAIVDDSYFSDSSLRAAEARGDLTLTDLDLGSDSGDLSDQDKHRFRYKEFVTIGEGNSFFRGLYQVLTYSKDQVAATTATEATLTGTEAGPFDFTGTKRVLQLLIGGLTTVEVEFSAGNSAITTVVNEINNDPDMGVEVTAADDGGGLLELTSTARGENASIRVITTDERSCHEILGLNPGTIVDGTGVVATVTIPTENCTGDKYVGLPITVSSYDAAAAGALTTEWVIQRATKGKFLAGKYTNQASMETGDDGEIVVEYVPSTAATAQDCFADVDIPVSHNLATKPVARLQVNA